MAVPAISAMSSLSAVNSMRSIQYAAAIRFSADVSGMLGRPLSLSRTMTAENAASVQAIADVLAGTADALSGRVALGFLHQPAQAIAAQAVVAAGRHRQTRGLLGAPAGTGQAAAEFRAARRTGELSGCGIF